MAGKFFVLLSTGLLCACAGSPQSFEDVDPDIQSAEANGVNLNIVAQQSLVSEGLAMTQIGGLLENIARGVQQNVPGVTPQTKWVQLQLHYDSTDRLGNEGFIDFGTIRLPISDIRAAKLENLHGEQMLDLVDDVSAGPAIDLAIKHCADPDNFRSTPQWCTRVAAAVGVD